MSISIAIGAVVLVPTSGSCQASPPPPGTVEKAEKKPPPTTRLTVQVLDHDSQKPVEGADVIVTSAADDDVEKELLTDRKGVALWSAAPRAKIVIRVIADNYQSAGASQTLKLADETVQVKLTKNP